MPEKPYAIVIEDDPKLSVIFQMVLQQAGFDTALDLNGDKYRSLLEAGKPVLVILDIHLPYATGGDILDEIRAKYPGTIVAVVTADFIKAKTLTGKADHILIKPVSVASLLKLAESVKRVAPMTKPLAIIVEDDPQLSQIFSIALEEDFDVEAIAEGDIAIERLRRDPAPRIVLLDLNLPRVSGSDILAYIRAEERLKETRVLLCTADERRQAEMLDNQADITLLKPVSPMQLRQMASRLK